MAFIHGVITSKTVLARCWDVTKVALEQLCEMNKWWGKKKQKNILFAQHYNLTSQYCVHLWCHFPIFHTLHSTCLVGICYAEGHKQVLNQETATLSSSSSSRNNFSLRYLSKWKQLNLHTDTISRTLLWTWRAVVHGTKTKSSGKERLYTRSKPRCLYHHKSVTIHEVAAPRLFLHRDTSE